MDYKVFTEKGSDFMTACEYRHVGVAKMLIENGLDICGNDDWALRWASQFGLVEIVKLLLDRGADVHARKDSALRWACRAGQVKTIELLLANGADIDAITDYDFIHSRCEKAIAEAKGLLRERGWKNVVKFNR